MPGYAVARAADAEDSYAGTDVPGEFRRLIAALGAEQLAVTLIRIPPHSDFEQGSGHFPKGQPDAELAPSPRGCQHDLSPRAQVSSFLLFS